MIDSHDSLYTPPVGRGFSADDLQREQLNQIEKIFTEQLPELVEFGTNVYVEELRQEQRQIALDVKMRQSLSPDHVKRAIEVFRRRAEAVLKAEAATQAAQDAASSASATAAAVNAAEVRIQNEKRAAKGR